MSVLGLMQKRGVVLTLALVLASFSLGGLPDVQGAPYAVSLTVAADKKLGHVNRKLLGNNLQWASGGDSLLIDNKLEFNPTILKEKVKPLGATVLRFPGGVLADTYHWRDGMGTLDQRGENEHAFTGVKETVRMGTQEFMELCEAMAAEPLITVNVVTGTAQEAAEWVRQVNILRLTSRSTGKQLPRVEYWEIGNEPYLKVEGRETLWLETAEYVRRADAIIAAMRTVDPTIKVGIPLRSDTIGGVPALHYPGFNATVLSTLNSTFDFVALHNAYMPIVLDDSQTDTQIFLGAMASTEEVKKDLAATRAQLAKYLPGRSIKIAITEYNALFSLPGRAIDRYLATPTGGLFVVDLLCVLAKQPDILMANFWSISDNWYFGAVKDGGSVRPAYPILREFSDLLRGELLETSTAGGLAMETPQVGLSPAQTALSSFVALATSEENVIRGVLLNRNPSSSAEAQLTISGVSPTGQRLRLSTYSSEAPFPAGDVATSFQLLEREESFSNGQKLVLPPRSVIFFKIFQGPIIKTMGWSLIYPLSSPAAYFILGGAVALEDVVCEGAARPPFLS